MSSVACRTIIIVRARFKIIIIWSCVSLTDVYRALLVFSARHNRFPSPKNDSHKNKTFLRSRRPRGPRASTVAAAAACSHHRPTLVVAARSVLACCVPETVPPKVRVDRRPRAECARGAICPGHVLVLPMDVQPAAGPVRAGAARQQAPQPVPGRRQSARRRRARQAAAAAASGGGGGHVPSGHPAAGDRRAAAHPAAGRHHAVRGRVTLCTYIVFFWGAAESAR